MTNGWNSTISMHVNKERLSDAYCFTHVRCHCANANKVMENGNQKGVLSSVAYKTLVQIGASYDLEGCLKNFS